MNRITPSFLSALALVTFAGAAGAQVPITVNGAVRHQTIEGLGVCATGTWLTEIQQLFAQPSFWRQARDDLGVSMVRIAIPNLQYDEDLDPNTLDWSRFDFTDLTLMGSLSRVLNENDVHAVKIIGTIWSPPWWMKSNNSPNGGVLLTTFYPHFAKYCAAVCLGFERNFDIPLYALSLQNEPVFQEPYESCSYNPEQYRDVTHQISTAFTRWNATSKLFGNEDVGTDPGRWLYYLEILFGDPVAGARMDALALHHFPWENDIYFTSPTAWTNVYNRTLSYGKPIWDTEVSGEDPTWLPGPSNDKGAITLAQQIHEAVTFGNVTAYVYWAIADLNPNIYSLMALDQPTKKYYACKQYFRYVRPGATRIDVTGNTTDILTSAFVNDGDHTATIVLINKGATSQAAELTLAGLPAYAPSSYRTIRSSQNENTAELAATTVANNHISIILPAYTVTTLFGGGATPCYANCDNSTVTPILNIADFVCFQSAFAAGNSSANCDGSTTSPVLNIADFVCFQSAFAAGCP